MNECLNFIFLAVTLMFAPVFAEESVVAGETPDAMEENALANDDEEALVTEEALENDDAEGGLSPAASSALQLARGEIDRLADMLAGVVDADSAASLAPQICEAYEALRDTDFSALIMEDAELVAAEFAEDIFQRMDAELARLEDAGYFGNAALVELFGYETQVPAAHAQRREASESVTDAPAQESGTESALPQLRDF